MKVPLGILIPDEKTDKQTILEHLGHNYYLITVGDKTTNPFTSFIGKNIQQIFFNRKK